MKFWRAALLISTVIVAQPADAAPVAAAVSLVGGLMAGTTTLAATFGAVGAMLIKLTAAVALSALSRAKMPKQQVAGIKTEYTKTGGTNSATFILGTYATAGAHVCPPMWHDREGHNADNPYLTYVIDIADMPGHAINRVAINGEWVTFEENPKEFTAIYGDRATGKYLDNEKYGSCAWMRYLGGHQTAADGMLMTYYADFPKRPWSAQMIGEGVCYAVMTFQFSPKTYSGLPSVRFEVDGLKIYDPRKDSSVGGSGAHRWNNPATWERSKNPAVMIYNILRGITLPDGSVWGGECEAADLPLDNWFAAMNICDQPVPLAAGGTEPRYRAGIEIAVADDEPASIIEMLLDACSGVISESGGVYRMRAGGPGLPVYFFTDDDLLVTSPQDFSPFPGLDESANGIHATYPDPRSVWEQRDAKPCYNSTYQAEDQGRQIVASVQLPAVPYPKQVQRLMWAWLRDDRRWRRHNIAMGPYASMLEPLDIVGWSSERNGYVTKSMEIDKAAVDLLTCTTSLGMREVDPSDYDWSADFELPDDPAEPGWDRPAALTVPGFAVAGVALPDASGALRRPALRLTWAGDDVAEDASLSWRVRLLGSTDVLLRGTVADANSGEVRVAGGILPAEEYEVQARLETTRRERQWTAWIPAVTPNIKLTSTDVDIPVADVVEDVIADALADVEAEARKFGIDPVNVLPAVGDHDGQLVLLMPDMVIYRWDAATGQWTTEIYAGIRPGSLDATRFATGIEPVMIWSGGSLPTTRQSSRVIFWGGTIYRWNGTAYVSSIPAADVTGQLVASQIADAAITTAKFAQGLEPVGISTAGSLPTTKSTSTLLWNGKLYRWNGSAYVASVPAADISGQVAAAQIAALEASKITGQLTDAQVAAVSAAKLTGTITETQISDNAISTPKIAAGAVSAAQIAAGAITAGKIAADAVTAAKIEAGAVTAAKITAGAVTAGKIAADAVTAGNIAAGAVTAGTIAADAVTAGTIAAGAVRASEIAADAIRATHLSADSVTANALAANSVTAGAISAGAVSTDKLAANSITAGKIAAGAVGADQIAANAITSKHLVVADFTNLIPNGGMGDDGAVVTDYWSWSAAAGTVAYLKATLFPTLSSSGMYSLLVQKASLGDTITASLNQLFAVTAGERLSFETRFRNNNGVSAPAGAYVRIRWFDADKVALDPAFTDALANAAIPATWVSSEVEVVVPARAAFARVQCINNSSNTLATNLIFDYLVLRRKNAGRLIVDGGITTNLIDVGAVTASRIAAGSVITSKIATGAITAGSGIIADAAIGRAMIADAAIGSAQIDNAAITSAKIANLSVGTIKIADNAITTLSSTSFGSVSVTGGYADMAVVNATVAVGDKLLIVASCDIPFGSAFPNSARLVVNGTVVPSSETFGYMNTNDPGAGYRTVAFARLHMLTATQTSLAVKLQGKVHGSGTYAFPNVGVGILRGMK